MSYFGKAIAEKDIIGLYKAYNSIYSLDNPAWKTAGQDTQYLIETDTKRKLIIVAFMGSQSYEDWMNNFECDTQKLCSFNGVDIMGHNGFFDSITSCNDVIFDELDKVRAKHPKFEIYSIGHSLGGAAAQVFAFLYFVRSNTKLHVITYGSPKPWANRETIDIVKSTIASICQVGRSNDAVVTLPPWYDSHLDCEKIGDFNLFHYMNVSKYHCTYDEKKNYDCKNIDEVLTKLSQKMA